MKKLFLGLFVLLSISASAQHPESPLNSSKKVGDYSHHGQESWLGNGSVKVTQVADLSGTEFDYAKDFIAYAFIRGFDLRYTTGENADYSLMVSINAKSDCKENTKKNLCFLANLKVLNSKGQELLNKEAITRIDPEKTNQWLDAKESALLDLLGDLKSFQGIKNLY